MMIALLQVPPFKLFKGPELWEGTGMVLVIESLVALAAIVEQQYEGAPPLVIDDQWKPPKLTDKQLTEIKKQLVRIKDKPVSGARPKVSPQIVLKKLALMAGNGVDSTCHYGDHAEICLLHHTSLCGFVMGHGLNATLCVCSQHVRAGLHPVPEPRARLPAEAALQGHGCVFAVAFSRIDVALRLTGRRHC